MRKYLSTLRKRSDTHKQNFALLVSGGITLTMFGLWFAVNYSEPAVVAKDTSVTQLAATHEVSPFESLSASVGASWEEVKGKVGGLFGNLGSVDIEQGYEQMKTNTLNTYGQ